MGVNKEISLCPLGVRMIEVRLYLDIYLLGFAKLYYPVRMFMCFRVFVRPCRSYSVFKPILPHQRFVPHELLCVQETGGSLALTVGPNIIDM